MGGLIARWTVARCVGQWWDRSGSAGTRELGCNGGHPPLQASKSTMPTCRRSLWPTASHRPVAEPVRSELHGGARQRRGHAVALGVPRTATRSPWRSPRAPRTRALLGPRLASPPHGRIIERFMSDFDQGEILRRLEMVEAEADAQRAEIRLLDVLVPVLEAEGYAVRHTGGPGDQGIDFLATCSDPKRGLPSRLGIQYKHTRRPIGTDTVERVVGASITSDLDRMLLLSLSGFSDTARRVLERALPTAVELIDLDSLRRWIKRLGTQGSELLRSEALIAIAELSATLARIIARNPIELDYIEWRDLERLVAAIFARLGFQTTLTPPAKDGGRDVILQFDVSGQSRSFIVEAKHWRSRQRVGQGHISDFVKVVASEQRSGGLVISTYGYTGTAFEALTEVERQNLYAGDKSKIVALCRTFVRAEAGLFAAPADLTEVITSDTLERR